MPVARVIASETGFQGRPQVKQSQCNAAAGYAVRFTSLFHGGRAMSFPCDGEGHVDMDALSPRAQRNYLYARAMVGREYAMPEVVACEAARTH